MSDAITRGIRVRVECDYMEEESNPDNNYYFFTYHVHISNHGEHVVQLMSRHWMITNSEGKVEEVKGPGVIGEQPILRPGESFSYSSYCPLSTPVGSMHGTYQMVEDGHHPFDAVIAPFTLALPGILH